MHAQAEPRVKTFALADLDDWFESPSTTSCPEIRYESSKLMPLKICTCEILPSHLGTRYV